MIDTIDSERMASVSGGYDGWQTLQAAGSGAAMAVDPRGPLGPLGTAYFPITGTIGAAVGAGLDAHRQLTAPRQR